MNTLSTSFTLGKASVQHNANIAHNNREFIAGNINQEKVADNVIYVKQNVRAAYQELFEQSLEEYNAKQKQPCRRIQDYYKHISESKREEAFYEIIVQFGDSKTAPCESENGELTKKMLDEYIRNFRQRNPNLHIFNAVLHMDEASPHLHIDFIPFYTQGRKNSLSKGVSMKAALIEQGLNPKSIRENQLVIWEENERAEMERILLKYGFTREDKNAKYEHQTVEQYKKSQDEKKIVEALKNMKIENKKVTPEDNVEKLKAKLSVIEEEKKILEQQKFSPYKSFFYSVPEKQAFVQKKLDELKIPYRETENGFEAQECYVEEIRRIEKQFKPVKSSTREKLRQTIDRLLMQSKDFDDLLDRLKKENYTIKHGKYIAVKPENGDNFIRLKSLGEQYSEYALRNRINSRKKYETDLQQQINSIKEKDSTEFILLKTIQFYTITFTKGALPMRKINSKKPFSWNNDAELDRLLELNKKINNGATIESLRLDFKNAEDVLAEKEKSLEKSCNDLAIYVDLKEKIEIVFEGKKSNKFTIQQAEQALQRYPHITQNNYKSIDKLIETEKTNSEKLQSEVDIARENLKKSADDFSDAEKIIGGTYVQSLVGEERKRREAKYVPNGLKNS